MMATMPLRSIIGHAPVIELLTTAVARDRVPQSLLLAGPEGVGKRAVAVALAQAVNCPRRDGGDACGTCAICRRIERGQFPDVTVVDKGDEASIKIKVLRERVLDAVGYRPFEGRRRVFIIDPADELTIEAQDALLKTLEEPPSAAMLILVTAYPDSLLPTIQSRCRRLRFGWLAERDVARILTDRLGRDRHEAALMAARSGGTVARALAEDTRHFEADRDAAVALLRAARGSALEPKLTASQALAKHGSKRRDREALADRLAVVASLLRDLIALDVGGTNALANTDLEADVRSLAQGFTTGRATEAYGAITRALAALDRNASPKIVADWVAVNV
jgi:DNA polymerase-3 subunit delta'